MQVPHVYGLPGHCESSTGLPDNMHCLAYLPWEQSPALTLSQTFLSSSLLKSYSDQYGLGQAAVLQDLVSDERPLMHSMSGSTVLLPEGETENQIDRLI